MIHLYFCLPRTRWQEKTTMTLYYMTLMVRRTSPSKLFLQPYVHSCLLLLLFWKEKNNNRRPWGMAEHSGTLLSKLKDLSLIIQHPPYKSGKPEQACNTHVGKRDRLVSRAGCVLWLAKAAGQAWVNQVEINRGNMISFRVSKMKPCWRKELSILPQATWTW